MSDRRLSTKEWLFDQRLAPARQSSGFYRLAHAYRDFTRRVELAA